MALNAIGPQPFDAALRREMVVGAWRPTGGAGTTFLEHTASKNIGDVRSIRMSSLAGWIGDEQLQQLSALLSAYLGVEVTVEHLPPNLCRMLRGSTDAQITSAVERALGAGSSATVILTASSGDPSWNPDPRVVLVPIELPRSAEAETASQQLRRHFNAVAPWLLHHVFCIDVCGWFEDCYMGQRGMGRGMHLCPVCLRKLLHSTQQDPVERYATLRKLLQAAGLAEEAYWISERLQVTGAPDMADSINLDTSMFPDQTSVRVEAQFTNGEWYPATVTTRSAETVSVLFDDGYVLEGLGLDSIRELVSS